MQLKISRTRFVLLIGCWAIKFGRIDFVRLFLRCILFPFFGSFWKTPFRIAVCDYVIGLLCNRREYYYCQSIDDDRVSKTLAMFLGGVIVIQTRGEEVTLDELARECPTYMEMRHFRTGDMRRPRQYARFSDGRIRLVDYGSEPACEALFTTHDHQTHISLNREFGIRRLTAIS